uniref:BHLH domain-containing protein n=1 Tax=Anopheles melas TaxID=34690 RepID=A0A182THF9_9DIPT
MFSALGPTVDLTVLYTLSLVVSATLSPKFAIIYVRLKSEENGSAGNNNNNNISNNNNNNGINSSSSSSSNGNNIPMDKDEKRMRREIANSNERRRMQSINAGFQSLRQMLPHHEGEKLSKYVGFQ